MADEWTIFLDMDGVYVDFLQGALRAHDRLDLLAKPGWVPDIMGMDEDEFWAVIDPLGPQFWRDLPEYRWSQALLAAMQELGKVVFLTKPSRSPNAAAGKMMWLQDRFGPKFRDYILTPDKRYCSTWPNSVLVDDLDANLEGWQGRKVCFPQPWNRTRRQPDPRTIVAEMRANVQAQMVA